MTLCLSFRSVRSTFSSSICAFEFRLPSMELYISKRSALFLLRITHRFSLRYRPVLAFLLKTILQFFFKESQTLFKSCVPVRIHFAFCSISAYWRKQIFFQLCKFRMSTYRCVRKAILLNRRVLSRARIRLRVFPCIQFAHRFDLVLCLANICPCRIPSRYDTPTAALRLETHLPKGYALYACANWFWRFQTRPLTQRSRLSLSGPLACPPVL